MADTTDAPERGLTLAFKTIEQKGGMPFAIAAVAEGFCPCCEGRLKSADGVEVMDDPYPTTPSGRGNCNACMLVWSVGTGGWGDWLTMDDHYDGMLRRMALNPGPDPDDDLDDEWEEDWSD